MNDIEQDRAFEEQKDLAEKTERQSKGLLLCVSCGAEVTKQYNCGNPNCQIVGCVHCLTYDEPYGEYFCKNENQCLHTRLLFELNACADSMTNETRAKHYLLENVKRAMQNCGDVNVKLELELIVANVEQGIYE